MFWLDDSRCCAFCLYTQKHLKIRLSSFLAFSKAFELHFLYISFAALNSTFRFAFMLFHSYAVELLNSSGLAAGLDIRTLSKRFAAKRAMCLVDLVWTKNSEMKIEFPIEIEKIYKHKYTHTHASCFEYVAHCIRLHSPS